MDPIKTKPALIAGAATGIVSGLPSMVPFVNCCCCLLSLAGGILAAKLYSNAVGGRTITPAEGATVGAMAGGVAAAVYLVIAIPLGLLVDAAWFATMSSVESLPFDVMGLAFGIVGDIFAAILLVGLSTLGGLLGSSLFKGPVAPTPPPSYPGGPYAGPYNPGGHSY
jgi:hypothetical protein